jgi:competence protein ComEA
MTSGQPKPIGKSPLPLPSRNDECVLALLLFVTTSCGITAWAFFGGTQSFVDIDTIQSKQVKLRIDLHSATWPEFTLIPGIGEKLAQRIVASREFEGRFASFDDLTRVHGIGPVTLEQIKPFLLPLPAATSVHRATEPP